MYFMKILNTNIRFPIIKLKDATCKTLILFPAKAFSTLTKGDINIQP